VVHVIPANGDNGPIADQHDGTESFRGATFSDADFTGATFRACELRNLKVVDSLLVDVNISGIVGNFVVNDVDVTVFVETELERRHPERAQLRQMQTPDDYRAMWDTIERLWSETTTRARRLPEPARQERVDDEWSFVETMRHLVFATDAWASRTVLDDPLPYHRLGYTHSSYPPTEAAAIGIDLDARPTFDEVMAVRADRLAVMRRIVDGLTADELDRQCARSPAPTYPEKPRTVGECLRVVMEEECEHHRYILRDLAVLEARTSGVDPVEAEPG
jgi:DinB superfamily/Pentapeptide repeats (8 copies)